MARLSRGAGTNAPLTPAALCHLPARALEYLLDSEDIGRLILVGQVAEQCILYSALDAYMRHFEVVVPRDALAHIDDELAAASLRMMEENMHAQVVDAADALSVADD